MTERIRRIVADSSADTLTMEGADFAAAPLKIVTEQREYVDDGALDVSAMAAELAAYKGRSGTACPSVGDWLEAFGEAEEVFCLTITGELSGSYNAAVIAARDYEERHPHRRVFVMDTRSTGPHMRLILEHIRHCLAQGMSFEQVRDSATAYGARTGLLFVLESMRNLANNGRVSPLAAKAAGLLGIRAVGHAKEGNLAMLDKCRGQEKTRESVLRHLTALGYEGGAVRISHVDNPAAAEALRQALIARYPAAEVQVYGARGLCSFYAERGGLLIGFEK